MEEIASTQNLNNDTATGAVQAAVQQGEAIIAGDKEYLDGYFEICRLYRLKRIVLDKIQRKRSTCELTGNGRFNSRLAILNSRIQTQEAIFWKKVERDCGRGAEFSIEKIATKYSLDLFEKKILLFFLYLENFAIEKNICKEDELLYIFDTENSLLSRMRNLKYFMLGAALFKNDLLIKNFPNERGCARADIAIASNALGMVSDMLSGKECVGNEPKKSSGSEKIGYVKDPMYRLEDVSLDEGIKENVRLFLDAYRDNKLETLGIAQRIKKGLGTALLFYGPPGTGKSMLAEAVAAYVGKKVLMVEYPKIMDRWVGATDKNISTIFKCAEEEDLVVILDEADTLFYNRSFAFEEHDIRFVNEMLQELEKFKGIIVLTTNMDILLDQALERRLALKVKLQSPTKELRLKIWQSHMPDKVKLAEGVDFNALAEKYDFSGGNIKNAVLNAFRKMISRNSDTLTSEDLIFGAHLEKEGMLNPNTKRNVLGFSI